MKNTAFALLTVMALTHGVLPAQIEQDPRKRIQEILDEVAEEMAQIDKWLQDTSRSKAAAKAMKENIRRLNELLDNVGESQKKVVKGIDDLLKEAQKMKGNQKGDPFSKKNQQQQQRQQQQRDQQRSQRRQPPQPQQRDQQPQNRPQKGKRERNERPETEKGKNVASNKPPKRGTERVDARKIPGAWGDLPDYVLQHGRGSMPTVPEKYRKYLEAMTKGKKK